MIKLLKRFFFARKRRKAIRKMCANIPKPEPYIGKYLRTDRGLFDDIIDTNQTAETDWRG